jgi:CTP synthase
MFLTWDYCRIDHPFFVGLQAHPEFCTRPLNPSPPFLGLVAASCGLSVMDEQLEIQLASFRPPHPDHVMVSEAILRDKTVERDFGVRINGD